MKFKDIQVGDIVYIREEVTYGWGERRLFFCPKKVERVTAKQFTVGGYRYRKENGKMIGGYSYAYYSGDSLSSISGDKVVDQSKEMQAFKHRLQIRYQVRDMGEKLRRISIEHPNLMAIYEVLKGLEI